MTLLENISANNGWAMAATGAIIVLIGLAMLALIIAQLHHVIEFFEKFGNKAPPQPTPPQTSFAGAEAGILNDPAAAARIYRPLTLSLGDSFLLSKLYEIFKQENIAHPHLTIRSLREAGYLVKKDADLFYWNI